MPAVTKSRWSRGFWKRVNIPVLKFSTVECPWLRPEPTCTSCPGINSAFEASHSRPPQSRLQSTTHNCRWMRIRGATTIAQRVRHARTAAPSAIAGPSGPTGSPEPTAQAHEANFTKNVFTLKICPGCGRSGSDLKRVSHSVDLSILLAAAFTGGACLRHVAAIKIRHHLRHTRACRPLAQRSVDALALRCVGRQALHDMDRDEPAAAGATSTTVQVATLTSSVL